LVPCALCVPACVRARADEDRKFNETMIDIDFERLRAIGLSPYVANQLFTLENPPPDTARLMRVVEVQRDWYALHDGHTELRARALQKLLHALEQEDAHLTVGDWVLAEHHDTGEFWISTRLAPVTQIARRANDGRRQLLASNVDTALLVMGLDADFNPRRMERYIAMVRACDVVPVVVLTKADISADAKQRVAEVCQRLPATIPVLAVNGLSNQARIELAPWVHAGQTLVLLGSSGAPAPCPARHPSTCWSASTCRRLHHRHAGPAYLAGRCGQPGPGGDLSRHRSACVAVPIPQLPA
jgi:ribosome biogenesis GTPase / thiamine phosphate phosphatase